MIEYTEPYAQALELLELFESEPKLINSQLLYDRTAEDIYTALANKLQETAPGMVLSPVLENLAQLLEIWGYEFNYFPYQVWISLLQWEGIQLKPEQFPTLTLRLFKDTAAKQYNVSTIIPIGTRFNAVNNPNLQAIALKNVDTAANINVDFVDVPARLNTSLIDLNTTTVEFNLNNSLTGFYKLEIVGAINSGKPKESLRQACLRNRNEKSRAKALITIDDVKRLAFDYGAEKVLTLPKKLPGITGNFNNVTTVAVYPPELTPTLDQVLNEYSLISNSIYIQPAIIKTVSATLEINKISTVAITTVTQEINNILDNEFSIANQRWNEKQIDNLIKRTLNNSVLIYNVEVLNLKIDGIDFDAFSKTIQPWFLYSFKSQNFNLIILA